jgi:hypothetical protein
MFVIPAEIQTLLKEKQMTGDDRPTAELLVVGAPGGTVLTDPTSYSTWRKFVGDSPVRHYGNMVETLNERAICSFVEGSAVYVAFANSVAEVLAGTQALASPLKIKDVNEYGEVQTSLTMIDGELHLAITNWTWPEPQTAEDWTLEVEHWIDSTGNGSNFVFHNYISTDLSSGTTWGRELPNVGATMGPIIPLSENNWIIVCPHYNYIYARSRICYSLDKGETWANGEATPASLMNVLGSCGVSVLPLSESSFMCAWGTSSDSYSPLYFTDNGATLYRGTWPGAKFSQRTAWQIVGDSVYMFRGGDPISLYKFDGVPADLAFELVIDIENWILLGTINSDGDITYITSLTKNALIIQHTVPNVRISGAGTDVEKIPIPIKSIVVDRSKGGASQAVVVIDNSLGMFAPDSTGVWWHVLWFNKEIQIRMGYGAQRQLVFTGLIDTIRMSTYPAELTIKARDYSKLALDQMPQDDFYVGYDGNPRYAFTYYDKTPEYIFGDMATQAGWALGTVFVEVSGITIPQFETGHEKIGDSFQRLCELTGFEWFTDEVGNLYFRKAKDPSAVSVYSFVEGVDIFSLEYELDDEELYRTIVVWSGDENRDVIKSSGVWPAADYNNVLAKKTMIVNASDIVTDQAGADAMVLAISNGITPKVRNVDFVVVGNPYLQIGDLIQVTETSSWISEYYRITEISHQMNSAGSPVFGTGLKCFHFSYEG